MSQHVSCNDCSLSPVCLPLAVAPAQMDQLDNIIRRGRPLKRGEHLYRASDNFESVFLNHKTAFAKFGLVFDLTSVKEQLNTNF